MTQRIRLLFLALAAAISFGNDAHAQWIEGWGASAGGQVEAAPIGENFTAVASTLECTFAIRPNGTITGWGSDASGLISDIPAGGGFVALDAGENFAMALRQDGSLVSWTGGGPLPGTPNSSGFVGIACGRAHALALRTDGTIAAWGADNAGQVSGVPSVGPAIAIGAGDDVSIASIPSSFADSIRVWGDVNGSNAVPIFGLPFFGAADKVDVSVEGGVLLDSTTTEAWTWGTLVFPQQGFGTFGVRDIAAYSGGTVLMYLNGNLDFFGFDVSGSITDRYVGPDAIALFAQGFTFYTSIGQDCDSSGTYDSIEIDAGALVDGNVNGTPDVCEGPRVPFRVLGTDVYSNSSLSVLLSANDTSTDPLQGLPTATRPVLAITVAGFEPGSGPVEVEIRSAEHSVVVTPFSVQPQQILVELPAMPPGRESGSTLDTDVIVRLGSSESAELLDGLSYTIYEVQVPPGTGATVQAAISAALPGTRIRLTPFASYTNFSVNLSGRSGITLMGDPKAPASVECFGNMTSAGITLSGTDATVGVSGIQIRDARPGIALSNSSSWIADALIEGNTGTTSLGGGIDVRNGSAPVLVGLRVNENSSAGAGGGVRIDGSSAHVRDCLILENLAGTDGGGIYLGPSSGSDPVRIENCTFQCNAAAGGAGGAVYAAPGASLRMRDDVVSFSFAARRGHGVCLDGTGYCEIARCRFVNNGDAEFPPCDTFLAPDQHTEGGGLYVRSSALPLVEDNDFTLNLASVGGGLFIAELSNPRVARNCFTCNRAARAPQDGPSDFFGPGIHVAGSSFGNSAQPDILNNALVDNRVVGQPGLPSNQRGHGIDGGFQGQGAPQVANNLVAQFPGSSCDGLPFVEQGWGIHYDSNRFTSIRSNLVFQSLEGSGGGCDGSAFTPDDAVCPSCCPLSGTVDGNVFGSPGVFDYCTEPGPGSAAFQAGLASAPALPPKLYGPGVPVSIGRLGRDGVFPNPAILPQPSNFVREAATGSSLEVTGTTIGSSELQIDTDTVALPSGLFGESVVQATDVVTFAFRGPTGAPTQGVTEATLSLPTLPLVNGAYELALFEFDSGSGSFTDTGVRSSQVDDGLAVFEGVESFGAPVVGVVRREQAPVKIGTIFCSSNANSTGMVASINVCGSTSVSSNDVTLGAQQLPANATTFFITSLAPDFTPMPAGSQGNLCLTGSIGRYVGSGQVLNAGPLGAVTLPIDLPTTPSAQGFVTVLAGETRRWQAWFRDANPSLTSNFTNAIEVTFTP